MPEYMAALLAASPPNSLTCSVFYYDNGSHAGCIVYIGADRLTIKHEGNQRDVDRRAW